MPFKSDAQRRLIYAKAAEGVPWARKFLRDSGVTDLPAVRRKALGQMRKAKR